MNDYNIVVAGSRGFTDYAKMKSCLTGSIRRAEIRGLNPVIVSGTAGGADKLGERYAREHSLDVKLMPADWNTHGKKAGYLRNVAMGSIANEVVLFWDSVSPGTKHMLDIATANGVNTQLIEYTKPSVYIVTGDLLDSDCTVIAHQANCLKVMGTGIAKSLVLRYPEVAKADIDFPLGDLDRLGQCSRTYVDGGKRVVVNLYGQLDYGRTGCHTDYNALSQALSVTLVGLRILEDKGYHVKFGLPFKIGCGLAGGEWHIVHDIISSLSRKFNRDIYLYKLP